MDHTALCSRMGSHKFIVNIVSVINCNLHLAMVMVKLLDNFLSCYHERIGSTGTTYNLISFSKIHAVTYFCQCHALT